MNNLPDEFVKRIRHQLSPEESDAFFSALQQPAPVSIRLNEEKQQDSFETGQPVAWCRSGFYLPQRPVFTLDPFFHAGTYYVQEAGSMLIEKMLEPHLAGLSTGTILDACAAPGGKSTHLLTLLGKDCTLVSNEIIPNRNKTLRYNLSKWGYANTIITQSSPDQLASTQARFDLIVVDAPCSGEGLFRKDPEARKEWSSEQAQQCAYRQENILSTLTPLLKEGGLLLYSTCTYNPAENDHQIDLLLQTGKFEVIRGAAPDGIMATVHGWQSYPHKVRSEGFYCCLLRYTASTAPAGRTKGTSPDHFKDPSGILNTWMQKNDDLKIYQHKPFLHFAGSKTIATIQQLTGSYIRDFGIRAGELKGKDLIPSANLALSIDVSRELPVVSLQKTEALEYLRCGPIQQSTGENGWHLVCYESAILGWAKKINQRWNNYHPKEHRILMDIDIKEE